MKTIKSLVLILIISFTAPALSGQKIFRDGYIVKKMGESLVGLVQYSDKQGVPSECAFKRFDIAREVVYTPSELQAFGYRNGNRYESREIDNKVIFLEVIATGKIILYQRGSRYYIDKDHLGLVELKNGPVRYNTAEGQKEFNNLPAFLTAVTEGKAGPVPEKFNVKEEIVPLVISYNKTSGNSYNVFNRSISEKQLTQETWKSGAAKNRFGVVSGLNMYTLNLKFNPDMFGITNEDYVPNPEKETGLVFGLTYERLLSRRSDRFSVRIDMLVNSQDFYSYSERENNVGGITRDDANFGFTGLKLPVLFQYSLTGGRIVPYVNAGIAYQYFLSTDYQHVAEEENTFHEIYTYHDSNMLFKSGELTGAGGLGVRTRIFSSINIHLMYMFEYGKGVFLNTNPTDTNNRKNDPYVENSIQSTFMLGITF
jgi:ribosomal protein L27